MPVYTSFQFGNQILRPATKILRPRWTLQPKERAPSGVLLPMNDSIYVIDYAAGECSATQELQLGSSDTAHASCDGR